MVSRAILPAWLTMPPEILRLVTKARMPFFRTIDMQRDFPAFKDAQQPRLLAMEARQGPVQHHEASGLS